MTDDPLERNFVASQVGEAFANYGIADEPLSPQIHRQQAMTNQGALGERSRPNVLFDADIWQHLARSDTQWPERLNIPVAAVSEWVARVPGLYWFKSQDRCAWDSKAPPRLFEAMKVGQNSGMTPLLESQVVLGGVGTIRMPPADDRYRLITLTTSLNASTGIPALVSPEVWDHHKLCEGRIVGVTARLQHLPLRWAREFPTIAGIPRLCLVIDNPDAVDINPYGQGGIRPVLVHPFSLLEYWDGQTLLHDFIFAAAESTLPRFRHDMTTFFESVRSRNGRQGKYITSGDIAEPMWDAKFASPADMRSNSAEVKVVEARIADSMLGQDTIDALLRRLSGMNPADLQRLSTAAGISPQIWSQPGPLGQEAIRMVDTVLQRGQLKALLYEMALDDAT